MSDRTSARPAVGVLIGNPRPASRTTTIALEVANRVAVAVGGTVGHVVELAAHGPAVLDPAATEVADDVAAVAGLDAVVVASPTYKATYTGLLKCFLDRYGPAGLAGVVAIPVMVGGSAHHAMAGEVHLRPLLVELGAVVPARSLYVIDSELDALPTTVGTWLERSASALRAALNVTAGCA